MNKILSVLTVSVFLISCQKEINFSNAGSNSGGSEGALLVKTTTVSATDSSQVNYFYDANKRLVREVISGTSGGQDISNDITLVRNSSGIITQTVLKSPSLQIVGMDSIITKVYYDNSSKKYTAASQLLSLYGLDVVDSTVYSYSGNFIVETNEYQTFSGLTYLALKSDFTYAGPNLTTVKSYATDSTGNLSLAATYKFTYDSKTSPIILPAGEAFVLGNYVYVSTNNPVTYQILDGSGAILSSNNLSYTYNSSNRPQSAKILDASGTTSTATFFYQ